MTGVLSMTDARGESVDPRETAHYHRLAQAWWDPDGPFWPLHGLNRFRVGYLRQRVAEHYHSDADDRPAAGLSVVDRTGVAVSPVTRRFRYTSSLAVNYLMTAIRENKPGVSLA